MIETLIFLDLNMPKKTGLECLTEIKANRTFSVKMLSNMNKVASLIDRPVNKKLIYGGDQNFETKETNITAWFDISP